MRKPYCRAFIIGGRKLEMVNRPKKKKSKLGMRRTGFIIAFLAPTLFVF